MKVVSSLRDLEQFGIVVLTGEACGLMYRVLCDLTPQGKRIVERCFDVRIESDPWNHGTPENPHIASIMLSPELVRPLAVFALLEAGYSECWSGKDGIVAFDESDRPEMVEVWKRSQELGRRYSYSGTAGSRNRHEFTGRET